MIKFRKLNKQDKKLIKNLILNEGNNYSKLEKNGLPKVNTFMEENDVIIARINLLDKKIDGLEAVITKHVEELKKTEKNKSTKGK